MTDPNPLTAMPFAESLANQMNESLQWMSRMWGNPSAASAGAETVFGRQPPLPPGLPSMLMPTFDPQELEKRINDLKTVRHWLDMNRALLDSTIQALQMQHDGIVALQSMQRAVPGGSPASGSTDAPPAAAPAPAAQPRADPAASPLPFDPAMWWNALQEQFARVAAAASEQRQPPATGPGSQREADSARPSTGQPSSLHPDKSPGEASDSSG